MFKKLVPVLGALLLAGPLAIAPIAAVAAPAAAHHVTHKKWSKKAMHKTWHKKAMKHHVATKHHMAKKKA